jgi:1-acyl-sn-glycerol-3-phosphate acyltransferase
MSDLFYSVVRTLGWPVMTVASRPLFLHERRLRTSPGPVLVAPNHLSPYDVPCLMAATRRCLDFVSIVEIFDKPLVGRFMAAMNAFPLDRGRVDPATTRTILRRLQAGRTVVMFPEGHVRAPERSLLSGGTFKPSVVRIARIANATILPVVVLGTGAFARPAAWLPLRRTRYAVAFGHPIPAPADADADEAATVSAMRQAYDELYAELRAASALTVDTTPWRR